MNPVGIHSMQVLQFLSLMLAISTHGRIIANHVMKWWLQSDIVTSRLKMVFRGQGKGGGCHGIVFVTKFNVYSTPKFTKYLRSYNCLRICYDEKKLNNINSFLVYYKNFLLITLKIVFCQNTYYVRVKNMAK